MFAFSESMDFDVPAAVVWPYLVAMEQVPLWEHGVLEVRKATPGPPALGTTITARRIYAGLETHLVGSVVAFEDGRSATIALRGGPHAESRVTYAVASRAEGRSTVTYAAVGELRQPLRLLYPVLPAVGRAEARKNLARLRRRIAAGIPPHSDAPTPAD